MASPSKYIKVTKKVGKILLWTLSIILLLVVIMYFTIQTSVAQTWLCKRVAGWLADKTHTRVEVKNVSIEFFKNVVIEGVYIEDLHKDTLVYFDKISVSIDNFDYKKQSVDLKNITIENSIANIVYYKNDTDLNFQFIKDALRGKKDTVPDTSAGWKVNFGDIFLKHFDFTYKDERYASGSRGIDFDDMHIKNIDSQIRGLKIEDDTISADIVDLSAIEKSGFILRKLSGHARISPIACKVDSMKFQTNASDIQTDLLLTYQHWDDYNHFVHKIKMNAKFNRSEIFLNDVGYFAPELKGFNQKVYLSGEVNGKVDGLKGKDIDIIFGHDTHFAGDFSFKGLPDIDETFMTINIRELTTSKKEVESIPIPPFDTEHFIKMSPNMALLGKVRYKGKLTGYYYDIVSDGIVTTAIGTVGSNIQLNQNTKSGEISYKGKLWTKDFDVGKLTANAPMLGKVTMHADVDGVGVKLATLHANFKKCIVDNLEFKGYNYTNIQAEGYLAKKVFNGKLSVNDDEVDLAFDGNVDFSKAPTKMHFHSQINKFDLAALHFVGPQNHISFMTTADVDIEGDNIDNIIGNVRLDNSAYIQDQYIYQFKNLDLLATKNTGEGRVFQLHSDLADATFKGTLDVAALVPGFEEIIGYYLPATKKKVDPRHKVKLVDEDVEYDIVLKDFDPVSHIFLPQLKVAPNTHISGMFDDETNDFTIKGNSDKITYAGTEILNWKISSSREDKVFNLNTSCDRYIISDTIWADHPSINTRITNDTMGFLVDWKNVSKKQNYGKLSGDVSFIAYPQISFNFHPSQVMVNDSLWEVSNDNSVIIDSTGSIIKINDLSFHNKKQELKVYGVISNNRNDRLKIALHEFNIANLNILTKPQGFELRGRISGNGDFANIKNTDSLIFSSNFDFEKIYVNNEEIGDGAVINKYDSKKESISINGDFRRGDLPFISVTGFYYPTKKKESLDLVAEVSNFKTSMFKPFIKDICDPFVGQISTNKLKIKGEPGAPLLSGSAYVQMDSVRLNYMNTLYHFSDSVYIEKNSFGVQDMKVMDMNEKVATVTGKVYHTNFKKFQLDFDINADKFCMLNTTINDNSLYYGKAFASGLINISGYIDQNIQIDATVKTDKVVIPGHPTEYTRFFLPLFGPLEASDNSFISFVKKDSTNKKDNDPKMDLSGIVLNLQLEATPDAEAEIIFDEKVGDIIKAKGNGNILMQINTNGNFNMYGDYEITNGDYLFTLQNIINKRFEIQSGSTIKWTGDPYDADINMNAVYVAKAALKPFFPEDSTAVYKKRVRTECVMNLTGALMAPTINFDINLPTVDPNTAQTVKSYISTQQELNQQIFTLLVLNQFTTPDALKGQANAENFSGSQAAGVTSSELLSNQLSNMLSQVSKSFDLGVNYRPGDNVSKDEVEFLVSKQLFNDRLTIDGAVGNNTNTSTQNSSTVVGDVNIDYKLRDDGKLRVKAYNKTNDNLILNPDAQYKQGVGIFYREEFDTIGELYRRYLGRTKKVDTTKTEGTK